MKFLSAALGVAALYASLASARLNSFSPNNDVTYTLGNYYPQAVDEFAGDPITNPLNITSGRQAWFVRVAFPRTYAWAAIGFGSEMNGARIFVVYTDGEGNVTVSPRRGTGHVEPQYDETVVNEGWLRVLEGSGDNIEDELREDLPMQTLAPRQYVKRQSDDDDDDDDGDDDDRRMVVANFLYITGKDGSRQPMIGSWQEGTPLATSELGARITKHDGHFQWRVENTDRIYVGATTNPFLPGGDRSNDAQENIEDSWDSDFDGRDDDDWISFLKTKTSERFTHAHGALMGIAFMFLFPLSAIIMRFSATRKLWLHLVLNVLAILCIIAGVAVGAYIKHKKGYLLEHSHFLYGIAILVLFLIQPVLGLLHHRQYLRTQKPTILGLIHRWYGRIIILVAMMNAWFGLGLADEPGEYWTAVGVSQGVLILLYILVVVVTWRRRRQLARKGSGEGFEQLRRREVNEGEGIPMGERSGAGVKM